MRRVLVVLAILGAACVTASMAVAVVTAGGTTIASAPIIPFGQEQQNSVNGVEYYRVPLKLNDRLTLRFGPLKQVSYVAICLFRPDVTDATAGNQPCVASKRVLSDTTLPISASASGLWTIAVYDETGGSSCAPGRTGCTRLVSYSLIAYVKHPTMLTASAPNLVRVGSNVTVRGRLVGGPRGRILVEQATATGWKTLGLPPLKANGRFALTFRARQKGSLTIRASFPEAPLYLGSVVTLSVRVA